MGVHWMRALGALQPHRIFKDGEPEVPIKSVLGRLHEAEEIRKVHDAGDIGLGKFHAAAIDKSVHHQWLRKSRRFANGANAFFLERVDPLKSRSAPSEIGHRLRERRDSGKS